MADIEITCADCRTTFIHNERDQAFYEAQQFTPPKRCKPCRAAKKQQREAQEAGRGHEAAPPDQGRNGRRYRA